MERDEKKQKIKALVDEMLEISRKDMSKKIDRILNSGSLDIDNWREDYNPMILPKIIITALLQNESTQYDGSGTSFEKEIKKEVKNLSYFL